MKNRIKNKRNAAKYALLQFLLISFFYPSMLHAEKYKNAIDTVFATSDSRMVISIEENDTIVELQVMAMGPLRAQSYSFNLAYNKNSLDLMLADLSDEAALAPNGLVTGNALQMQPVIANLGYSQEVMKHQELANRNMRSVTLTVTYSKTDVGESKYIKPAAGELMHVFSVFLQKKNAGVALNMTNDLGFHYNNSIPMSVSMWACMSSSVHAFAFNDGYQGHYYYNDTLFTYRTPSSIITEQATEIAGTSAVLNGISHRGAFFPSTTIINDGNSVMRNNARLDYDTVTKYGFIYSLENVEITSNSLSNKLIIEGIEYDFPDAVEIAAGTFTRDETEFYIVSFPNATADKDILYDANITGLIPITTYYAWAFNHYAFHTSDTYLNVGEMIEFTTEEQCDVPELPVVLASQSFCEGAIVADLIAIVPDTVELLWYDAFAESLDPTDLLVDGETYYAKSSFVDGCENPEVVEVKVTLINGLVAPTVTTPQIFCPGSLVSDLRADGDNIVWYDDLTVGNRLNSTDLLTDGFYYAAQEINGCESSVRSAVKVIIEETILEAPQIASPQNFCDNATLADIATDGSNIIWYSANGAILPATTLLVNATTYYAAYIAGTCESTEKTPVLVYTGMDGFVEAPAIASPQRFCEGASIQNIAVPNNQIIWYASETGSTQISSNTILSNDIVYYAAQKAGECESTERTPVRILLDNPQGPDAPSPQVFCGLDYTLADLEITGSGIVWYNASIEGNLLPSTTALTTVPTMYYAAQATSNCESARIGVLAYVNAMPQAPVISEDFVICADEETIDLASIIESTSEIAFTYYFDEGITVITDPANVPVPAYNTTYYVKATNMLTGCESESLGAINVVISNSPIVSVTPAGAYTSVNGTVTVTITDNNTNPAVGAKTVAIVDGNIASVQLVNDELEVTGIARGNTEVIYTSVNEDGCITEFIIPVQVEGLPTGILTGKDFVVCGEDTTTIVQIAYVMGGVAPWTVTVSDNRGIFSQDTVINSIEDFPVNMTVLLPKNTSGVPEYTTYVISNVEDALGANKQTNYGAVRIGVNPTPVINDIANKHQIVCAGESTLPISFDGIATIYRWSVDSNIGVANYSDGVISSFVAVNETANPITATILVTPEYWYNGVVCIGETDTATITVNPTPKANFVYNVAGLGTIQFTDKSSANIVEWNWDFGDDSTSALQNPTHTYLASGIYTVTLTVKYADGCEASISKEVKVTVSTNLRVDFVVNNRVQCLEGNEFLFTDKTAITTEGHYISAWLWNFGDGNTSTDKTPSHTYATAGTYTVTLVVTERPGNSNDSIKYIVNVIDAPMIIDGVAPDAICEGEKLQVSFPTIYWNGNTPVAGQWLLDGRLFDPNTTSLTSADDGKLLQYRVETSCGAAISEGVAISVYQAPVIVLESSVVEICGNVTIVKIPYTLINATAGVDIYYSILFNEDARRAGFRDVTNNLLTGDSISVTLPASLAGGIYYGGVISIQTDNGCQSNSTAAFDIFKSESIRIIKQPQSVIVCETQSVTLSVEVNSINVSYQWYRNGVAIPGAIFADYSFDYDPSLNEEYYVEVSNSCMTVTSNTVNIEENLLTILMKWDNVIYVNNPAWAFVSYQWCKDGLPIMKDGYAQYYSEETGFDGTYHVKCYYADGSYVETCPITLNTKKSTKVLLYPNPTEAGSQVMLEIQTNEYDIAGASLEIFDAAGKLVSKDVITGTITEITAPMAAGIYTARVITKTKHIFYERFVVGQ